MTLKNEGMDIPFSMIVLKYLYDEGERKTLRNLENELGITYSHLHMIKDIFVKKRFVNIRQEGLKKYIRLTEKGIKHANHLSEFLYGMDVRNKSDLLDIISNKKRKGDEHQEK